MIGELSHLMSSLIKIGEKSASNDVERILKEIFAAGKCTNSGGWKCLPGFPYISYHGVGDTVIFGDSQVGGSLGRQFRGIRYLSNGSKVSDWIGWMDDGFGENLKNTSKIYVILGGNGAAPGEAPTLVEKIRVYSQEDIVWITPAPPAEGYRRDRVSDRLHSNDNIVKDLAFFEKVRVVDSHGVVRSHYDGNSWKCPTKGPCDGIHLKGDVATVLGDKAKEKSE